MVSLLHHLHKEITNQVVEYEKFALEKETLMREVSEEDEEILKSVLSGMTEKQPDEILVLTDEDGARYVPDSELRGVCYRVERGYGKAYVVMVVDPNIMTIANYDDEPVRIDLSTAWWAETFIDRVARGAINEVAAAARNRAVVKPVLVLSPDRDIRIVFEDRDGVEISIIHIGGNPSWAESLIETYRLPANRFIDLTRAWARLSERLLDDKQTSGFEEEFLTRGLFTHARWKREARDTRIYIVIAESGQDRAKIIEFELSVAEFDDMMEWVADFSLVHSESGTQKLVQKLAGEPQHRLALDVINKSLVGEGHESGEVVSERR